MDALECEVFVVIVTGAYAVEWFVYSDCSDVYLACNCIWLVFQEFFQPPKWHIAILPIRASKNLFDLIT